ncbi:MAG: VCBS repeat-containing protein [Deltaproteobacteria bacterium]|nr:MAG: VCBS repeat-containing protein [Deltaproteobacteria bacterium]
MRCCLAVAAAAASAAACGDNAVVIEIAGDLLEPGGVDAFCLAVYDRDPAGAEFAARYRVAEVADLDALTLTVEAAAAEGGVAAVRGYRRGLELARSVRAFEFSGGVDVVDLRLDACRPHAAGAPAVVANADAPAGARIAVSFGRGGSRVAALGDGAALWRADGGLAGAGMLPAGAAPAAVVAFDADGDCDDDLLAVAADGSRLLRRRSDGGFDEVPGAVAATGTAAVAADVDGDGDIDAVIGGGAALAVYRNDGTGEFTGEPPLAGLTDVTALAVADLDGDGHVDLVVGQGDAVGAFPRVLFNDAPGTGAFALAPAALPEVALRARDVAIADVNADGVADVLVAVAGGPVRAFVNRGDGRLEDRSYVVLPSQPADAVAVAAGDWDGDCLDDAIVGLDVAGAIGWVGADTGAMSEEAMPAGDAADVALADIDDDGRRDAVVAGGGRVVWIAR